VKDTNVSNALCCILNAVVVGLNFNKVLFFLVACAQPIKAINFGYQIQTGIISSK